MISLVDSGSKRPALLKNLRTSTILTQIIDACIKIALHMSVYVNFSTC